MKALAGSPGRVENSDSYEAMFLYQRATWGYLAASGALVTALKLTTSAWDGPYLFVYSQTRHTLLSTCRIEVKTKGFEGVILRNAIARDWLESCGGVLIRLLNTDQFFSS